MTSQRIPGGRHTFCGLPQAFRDVLTSDDVETTVRANLVRGHAYSASTWRRPSSTSCMRLLGT